MDGVFEAAIAHGWPEDALHREYFAVPEQAEAPRLPFLLRLKSGRVLQVPAERNAAEALIEAGVHVDMKCSNGICGVCGVGYDPAESCEIEHRDFVLSNRERQARIVLCCSRAKSARRRDRAFAVMTGPGFPGGRARRIVIESADTPIRRK